MIKNTWIDSAWREEHDGVKIIPLAWVVEKFLMKNISTKTYFFPLVTSRTYSIRLTANSTILRKFGGHRSIAKIRGYRLAILANPNS